MRHRLMHQLGKRRKVEPASGGIFMYELLLARFWQRETKLVAADALWLYLKPRGAFEVGGGDPELVGFFARRADISRGVVINNGGVKFFSSRRQCSEQKQKQQTGADIGFHAVSIYGTIILLREFVFLRVYSRPNQLRCDRVSSSSASSGLGVSRFG